MDLYEENNNVKASKLQKIAAMRSEFVAENDGKRLYSTVYDEQS